MIYYMIVTLDAENHASSLVCKQMSLKREVDAHFAALTCIQRFYLSIISTNVC